MAGDLHTHTNFSDGSCDIETLPFLASRVGLTHLAVSDHDTVLAARYAYEHPQDRGVTLIPATELTAFDTQRGRRVHLLCYCPDLTPRLCAFCDAMAQRRNAAQEQAMTALEQMYAQFTREAAQAYAKRSGVVFKTHFMRVLMEYGYTDAIYGALYHELSRTIIPNPAYDSLDDVLSVIADARGVAVLAHPSVYNSMELAAQLASEGRIDGVEIHHPRNTPQDKAALLHLAAEHDLIVTGGTDFHGMHASKPLPLGTCTTEQAQIERLLALARRRKQ